MEELKVEKQTADHTHHHPLKTFSILLLIMEVIIIVLFIVFARMETEAQITSDQLWSQRYSAFQDVNVMIVVGFGFLMTFIRTHSWSALAYTFFINGIIVQTYILLKAFWQRVFNGFEAEGFYIKVGQVLITESSYAVASALIAFGSLIGRAGPRQLLVIAWLQMVGYALNELIVLQSIGAFDAGGSMTIHTFGAYFGLTVSLILSHKIAPVSKPEASYISNIVAMIGTLFLWLFWPSFNFGAFATTPFEQSQIVANTLLALTGSCVSTFAFSALLGNKFEMQDILNATLAGGVSVGACCGILYLPGVALAVGAISGAISVIGFKYVGPKLLQKIQLHDSCGVHNLHGMPGLFGGIVSAIVAACYNLGYDQTVAANYGQSNIFGSVRGSFLNQGGLQIAGTFCSMGMAIAFGIITGAIILLFYKQNPHAFYQDKRFFSSVPDFQGGSKYSDELKQSNAKDKEIVLRSTVNKFSSGIPEDLVGTENRMSSEVIPTKSIK